MKAFRQNVDTESHVSAGKKALKAAHRELIVESRQCKVTASFDFEDAAREIEGYARWDYFVELSHENGKCRAFEVHKFRPTELKEKKAGTLRILHQICPQVIDEIAGWHVAVTGDLARADLVARFTAETKIRIARRLILAQV